MPSLDQVIVWIIVGLIGGTLAGMLVAWNRRGVGWWRNLAIGLVGAIIGGFVFRVFGWLPELDKVSISLRDVIAAFAGSLVVLGALWLWQRSRQTSTIQR